MQTYQDEMNSYVRKISQALTGYAPVSNERQKQVYEAMAYSLLGGGKRIRGALTLAFYQLFSQEPADTAMPFAAAAEMIHAYSLVHDDLPCMDDDNLRRGKPTCHIAFGEAIALLAGDALQTLAFETMTRPEAIRRFGAEKVVAAVHVMAGLAGAKGMVGGQVIDLDSEDKTVTLEELEEMDTKKTGALICAAIQVGCILGGADLESTQHALAYGQKIGLVFQLVDDILDATGDVAITGKNIGGDEELGKSTYVSLLGVDEARELAVQYTHEAKQELQAIKGDTGWLAWLADELCLRQN